MVKVKKDLTGQRFGKLLVIEQSEDKIRPSGDHIAMWKCLCDCQEGKEIPQYVYKEGVELNKGRVTSCGCASKETRRKNLTKDLTGMKFGRLIALELYDYVKNSQDNYLARWKCICDCQKDLSEEERKYSYITSNSLLSGNTQSCGCLQKERTLESAHERKEYNKYELHGNYYIGYTSKGEKFYFDKKDYDLVKYEHWFVSGEGYIVAHGNDGLISMHRLVCGLDKENPNDVDHILGKKTRNDNRSANLRVCTRSQNQMNKPLQSNNTSGTTGVWKTPNGKWRSEIMKNRKKYILGTFSNIEDAVRVRKIAEEILFKDFSYENSQKIGEEAMKIYNIIHKDDIIEKVS